MDKIVINGGKPLNGEVIISGAKNAVLPIMTACVIEPGKYTLNNVPDLRDTRTMGRLIEMIGGSVQFHNNSMQINTINCDKPVAPYELVKTMRASFYVLGPFMSRYNYAEVSLPGGCAWGPRPVDFHLKALEAMGATISLERGNLISKGELHGAEIDFEKVSVGATGNTLMAALKANGKTIINNAACEPDITDLVDFLSKLGGDIKGRDTTQLTIQGMPELNGGFEYDIIPDRIEAGTFLIGVALTGGEVTLRNVNPEHLGVVISKLKEVGTDIQSDDNSITIRSSKKINPVDMTTAAYPGFPTDLQAQWMALMCLASGDSTIIDDIYHDRFTHMAELSRFGANLHLVDNVASVKGIEKFYGAPVMSTDIRASASLILAALAADGKSEISRIYHIDRGYENIELKLQGLGADIKRTKAKETL
ncbi:MAG: UDP-N-acetylglucosamine 1-carboxyvinyltransferase [Candidatus Marinimicrobia bacterium]|nr:UDP-N-acetylglucosamine 1-carboxyvinyltransferase [Candidatus Neomarinimicrobiota bacterium]